MLVEDGIIQDNNQKEVLEELQEKQSGGMQMVQQLHLFECRLNDSARQNQGEEGINGFFGNISTEIYVFYCCTFSAWCAYALLFLMGKKRVCNSWIDF